MTRSKFALVLFAAFALAVSACGNDKSSTTTAGSEPAKTAGSDPAREFVVGVSNLGLSFPFTAAISDGIKKAADELGVKIIELDAKADSNKQSNDVQDLIAQRVDGILLLPVDGGVSERQVDRIAEAGIPVIAVATQVGDPAERALKDVYPGLAALITQDELESGAIAGEMAVRLLPSGGKVAIIEGAAGFAEVKLRSELFEARLKEANAGFEIVARQPGDWLPDVAEAACQNILASNPGIALFYAQSDDMAVGCSRAIERAGSNAITIGIGGSALAIEGIKEGTVSGTVCYKPVDLGYLAMKTMYDLLSGRVELKGEFISYPTPAITPENVDECDPQW